MIVLIRCNDVVSDSRLKKYIDYLDKNCIEYRIIAWDRLGNSKRLPNVIYCNFRSKYNQGGIAAIIDRLKWMSFILFKLFSFKQKLVIHACDLDAVFPSAVYKFLSLRKNYLIFDVFDWISDTLYNQGRLVLWAFSVMEKFSVQKSDHIIICEQERVRQIPYNIERKYSVLQNIPSFTDRSFLSDNDDYHFDNELFTLVYVGGFTNDRCLKEIINGALKGAYNLNIAGYGDMSIVDTLNKVKSPYVRYYGKVDYKLGLNIMYNSDIIFALYSKKNPNHLYAAPNKFYECMFVGKAIITTKGIIIGEKVLDMQIGYVVDEDEKSIVRLVTSLSNEDIASKSLKAKEMWNSYEHKVDDYLNSTYKKLIGNN